MICNNCKNQLPDDALFCNVCGAKQDKNHAINKSKCAKCGAELIPGALFCNVCGNKIEEEQKPACPNCGKQIMNNMSFCAFCGAVLENKTKVNPVHYQPSSNKAPTSEHEAIAKDALDDAEALRKDSIYKKACSFSESKTKEDLEAAISLFSTISGWKDTDQRIVETIEEVNQIDKAAKEYSYRKLLQETETAEDREQYVDLANRFGELGDYKESSYHLSKCLKKIEEIDRETELENNYAAFISDMQKAKTESDYKALADQFATLGGYKDSEKHRADCLDRFEKLKVENEYKRIIYLMSEAKTENEFEELADRFATLGGYKDSEKLQADCFDNIEKLKAEALENEYNESLKALENAKTEDDYTTVANRFAKIKEYKDSLVRIEDCKTGIEKCRKEEKYKSAIEMMNSGDKEKVYMAIDVFKDLDKWKDSQTQIITCEKTLEQFKKRKKKLIISVVACILVMVAIGIGLYAYSIFQENARLAELEKARNKNIQGLISASAECTIAVKKDGTVISTKIDADKDTSRYKDDVKDLRNIIAVSAGNLDMLALRQDGTVYNSLRKYSSSKSSVEDEWTDIIAVSAGGYHYLGLKKDGTVESSYFEDYDNGQIDVDDWTDIVAISAGMYHSVGLKKDGTVISTKIVNTKDNKDNVDNNEHGQTDVDDWTDIVAVSASEYHTVGLKKDGTVVSTKISDDNGDYGQTDVDGWTDIVAVSAGKHHTVGLKKDGTVVSTKIPNDYGDYGQTDVDDWTDIVAVSAGEYHTVGLKKDGTMVSTKLSDDAGFADYGQTKVDKWKNII